jgi:hypothetical protein
MLKQGHFFSLCFALVLAFSSLLPIPLPPAVGVVAAVFLLVAFFFVPIFALLAILADVIIVQLVNISSLLAKNSYLSNIILLSLAFSLQT